MDDYKITLDPRAGGEPNRNGEVAPEISVEQVNRVTLEAAAEEARRTGKPQRCLVEAVGGGEIEVVGHGERGRRHPAGTVEAAERNTMSGPLGQTDRAKSCPLCLKAAGNLRENVAADTVYVTCTTCGNYAITGELQEDRDFDIDGAHPYLSAATRKATVRGQTLTLTTENWQDIEHFQRSLRVSEKIHELLRLIANHIEAPGRSWAICPKRDYPLITAADHAEVMTYLNHLQARELLIYKVQVIESLESISCEITIPGWELIEPTIQPGGNPSRCFVAMWFSPDMAAAYQDGIEPAVRDAGFVPVRIDQKEHNNEITDEIIAEIRNSGSVVADFTGQRTGVYYEAGFAFVRPLINPSSSRIFSTQRKLALCVSSQYNRRVREIVEWSGVVSSSAYPRNLRS
jgi:hypothetical protein